MIFLTMYCELKPVLGIPLQNIFIAAPDDLISLLELLLKLDPNQRCWARGALEHPYFR